MLQRVQENKLENFMDKLTASVGMNGFSVFRPHLLGVRRVDNYLFEAVMSYSPTLHLNPNTEFRRRKRSVRQTLVPVSTPSLRLTRKYIGQ